MLLGKGTITEGYRGGTKEFMVIGLTQRTYRRAWLNLPSILEECDAAFFERAICVEVNVEEAAMPFAQHGAQLTQAILLPDHPHVLELLPWIADYIR